jgi:hypothetical protein
VHRLIASAVPAAARLTSTTPEKGVAAIADPKAEFQGCQLASISTGHHAQAR